MANSISNSDDVIDSRDVIARIKELQSMREDSEGVNAEEQAAIFAADYPDEAEELAALEALQDEAEGYCPDWRHGATLIRDSYFTEYAQQLAEDIGAIDPKANWPLSHIDWKAAAEELKSDYTSVDFDGVEYWVR